MKKLIGILVCMLFIVSAFGTTSYSEKIETLENIVTDCNSYVDEHKVIITSQRVNRRVIPEITYAGESPYDILNTFQPTVVIENPDDGEEVTDPYIVVEGYAASEIYMYYYEWLWEWEDGSQTGGEEIEPVGYYEFSIDIGPLAVGENTITVTFYDVEDGSGSDSVTVYYVGSDEGFRIVSVFQPVQTVYLDDPLWGDDLDEWDKCYYSSMLDMIANKNTFLFGYPYSDRFNIRITACNNYDFPVDVEFVFTIYPDGKEVWRSPKETVPAKSIKTFVYGAPIPDQPFRWNTWSGSNYLKDGYIELSADIKTSGASVGGSAPCECEEVIVDLDIRKTHRIKVLVVPLTLKGGPAFPDDFTTEEGKYEFRRWLYGVEPWWNAIYPLGEDGLWVWHSRNWRIKHVKIKKENGDTFRIRNLNDYNSLTNKERSRAIGKILSIGGKPSRIAGFDRVVFLLHPDIVHYNRSLGKPLGLAANRTRHGDYYKHGVIMTWEYKGNEVVLAHEISHTYYLRDNYKYDKKQNKITYEGDHAVGYWVNHWKDIPTSYYDLMGCRHPVDKTWIKKPNYKDLYKILSEEKDPAVIDISGFIDKSDNVELDPWYTQDEGNIDLPWDRTGCYLVRSYDKNNNLLGETGFNVSYDWNLDFLNDDELDETIFSFRLELLNGLNRIDIVKASTDQVLASRTKSANSPQVTITSPSPGEEIKPGDVEIKWDGSDTDGDTLTYYMFITNTTDNNWYPIYWTDDETSWTADFSDLENDNYELKVFATDGWNTGEDIVNFVVKKGKDRSKAVNVQLLEYFSQRFLSLFPLLQILLQRLGLQ